MIIPVPPTLVPGKLAYTYLTELALINTSCRLHKEIEDFYDHVRPKDFEERIRQQVVQDLKNLCRSNYGDAEVYPFGSFPSGLYLPTGDIDLVFCSDSVRNGGRAKYDTKSVLFRFRALLTRTGFSLSNDIECIVKARVPLVKFIESRTGLKVDVSFENTTGVRAIETFLNWKKKYPVMPALVTLIKHFLAMRGLNEPVNGGIGGFSVICLVVSMLQMNPELQSQAMSPSHHLGDLLMEFLNLYGNRFDYHKNAISLNPPAYIAKVSFTLSFIPLVAISLVADPASAPFSLKLQALHTAIRIDCPSLTPTILRTTSPEGRPTPGPSLRSLPKHIVTYGSACLFCPKLTKLRSKVRASSRSSSRATILRSACSERTSKNWLSKD
jgi:non-canonical poly(A) RNA polymerase PAPD5/7